MAGSPFQSPTILAHLLVATTMKQMAQVRGSKPKNSLSLYILFFCNPYILFIQLYYTAVHFQADG